MTEPPLREPEALVERWLRHVASPDFRVYEGRVELVVAPASAVRAVVQLTRRLEQAKQVRVLSMTPCRDSTVRFLLELVLPVCLPALLRRWPPVVDVREASRGETPRLLVEVADGCPPALTPRPPLPEGEGVTPPPPAV